MDRILEVVHSVLPTTPARWLSMTQAFPYDLLTARPAPGEWSAMECLQHVLDTELVFQRRLQAFLMGEDFPTFRPDTQEALPDPTWQPLDYAREFSRRRDKSLPELAKLTEPDLKLKARHAELGMVTLSEMVHEWVAHDLNHTVQAERAMMQPFIKGCGPWQSYFSDHVVRS